MADNRPSPEHYEDPFADSTPRFNYNQGEQPYGSASSVHLRFESTTTLPQTIEDSEASEKQPLTAGEAFSGGFYPPKLFVKDFISQIRLS